MKKFLCFAILILLCGSVFAADQKVMYVSMDSLPLKAAASSTSKTIRTLEYASKVNVIQNKGNWVKVSLADNIKVEGWVPSSSVTSKKIKSKTASADAKEIALAGKGFNSTLETVYSYEYDISYDEVDYVESLEVPDEDIEDFIREGLLKGAAR